MSFSEKNTKRIKSPNSMVTSGVFIYNISTATISPSCKGFVPIIPCLPNSNSLLDIRLGFLPDMLLCLYLDKPPRLIHHSPFNMNHHGDLLSSKELDLDLHSTSANHPKATPLSLSSLETAPALKA